MQNTLLKLCASTALISSLSLPAAAQDIINLEEITFSANLAPSSVARIGSAVTVLTQNDLSSFHETSVLGPLSRVPGVAVAQRGPLGTQAGVTIRGVNQNNIAVSYEGIDITDPTGTQVAFNFGSLTLGGIGRLEVLRGSQSALYGSQAIGGAILMQGRRPWGEGPQSAFTIEAGSYKTLKLAYDYTLSTERSEFSLGLGRVKTDGFSAWDARGRPDAIADGFQEKRANLFYSLRLTEATTLELAGFWLSSAADFDDAFGSFFAEADNTEFKRQRGLRFGLAHEFDAFTLSADVSRLAINRVLEFPWGSLPYRGSRDAAKLELAFNLGAAWNVIAGAERKIERYRDNTQSEQIAVNSIYVQGNYAPDDANDLTFSGRYDRHSAFGGNLSGRITGVHRFSEDFRLRWSAGTGYRAPSNYELYGFYVDDFASPPVNVMVGDPSLQIERSHSFDIGVEQDFSDGRFGATAFFVRARDLLDYSLASFTFVQRNGTSARYGIELSGAWALTDTVEVSGAYTYTRTSMNVALDSSGWGTSVPRHVLNLGANWQVNDRLGITASMTAVAKKPDLKDYAVANLAASYELREGIDAYLRIENLFNKQYQQVANYGTSDRAFYLGVASRF